ncbi:MAG TPA: DUF3078 domain-containing protein [Puia sp.]|nr:DUF3078 domain-containing protein [Puia sp.]
MKKAFLAAIILFGISSSWAQDKSVKDLKDNASKAISKDPNDTIPKIWKTGGLINLTFNQAALSNWSAGGDESSLALTSSLYAYAFYKKERNSWDNTLNLAFGGVKTSSLGTRKSDDRFDLLSKYGYEFTKSWYLGLLFNARTQFAKGYTYPTSNSRVLTSDFLAPAYVLLSPGINYMPNDNFSIFLSPATVRWVIVKNDSLSSVGAFGVDSGKNIKTEFGAYASISYSAKMSSTAVYTGRLDFFSNYLHEPQNIDIYMTNLLAVKIAKLLSMTLSVNVVYDNDIQSVKSDGTKGGPKPQIQEIFGIGLAYKF